MTTLLEEPEAPSAAPLEALVARAQAGDRAAFGLLAGRYESLVYGVALRHLGHQAEAQELVQEVLMQALRKLPQLREPAAFPGWLRAIAQRRAINRRTRQRRHVEADSQMLDAACADEGTPLEGALARERAAQVRQGLERLGPLDRQTLEAFYMEGRSLLEISAAFESPVGTIKRRLHVARKRLANELRDLAPA